MSVRNTLILLGVALPTVAAFAAHSYRSASQNDVRNAEMSNLTTHRMEQLGDAIQRYAKTHDNRLPDLQSIESLERTVATSLHPQG